MNYQYLTAWFKHDSTTPMRLGEIPGPSFVFAPLISIPTAFDNTASIVIGHSGDTNAFGLTKSLTSIIDNYDEMGKGVETGYLANGELAIITLTNNPTVGEAIIILPFIRIPFK